MYVWALYYQKTAVAFGRCAAWIVFSAWGRHFQEPEIDTRIFRKLVRAPFQHVITITVMQQELSQTAKWKL